MSDTYADLKRAFIRDNGMARIDAILWDDELKIMYFQHFGVSVTQLHLEPGEDARGDFETWPDNYTKNANAEVLWASPTSMYHPDNAEE